MQRISVPLLWFMLNMGWLLFVSVMLMKLMRALGEKANGALTMRVKINKKISIPKLNLQSERTLCAKCNQPVWRGQQCSKCGTVPGLELTGTARAKAALAQSQVTGGGHAERANAAADERKAELAAMISPRGGAKAAAAEEMAAKDDE